MAAMVSEGSTCPGAAAVARAQSLRERRSFLRDRPDNRDSEHGKVIAEARYAMVWRDTLAVNGDVSELHVVFWHSTPNNKITYCIALAFRGLRLQEPGWHERFQR